MFPNPADAAVGADASYPQQPDALLWQPCSCSVSGAGCGNGTGTRFHYSLFPIKHRATVCDSRPIHGSTLLRIYYQMLMYMCVRGGRL